MATNKTLAQKKNLGPMTRAMALGVGLNAARAAEQPQTSSSASGFAAIPREATKPVLQLPDRSYGKYHDEAESERSKQADMLERGQAFVGQEAISQDSFIDDNRQSDDTSFTPDSFDQSVGEETEEETVDEVEEELAEQEEARELAILQADAARQQQQLLEQQEEEEARVAAANQEAREKQREKKYHTVAGLNPILGIFMENLSLIATFGPKLGLVPKQSLPITLTTLVADLLASEMILSVFLIMLVITVVVVIIAATIL